MSYMDANANFAPAAGIQELSFDEINHVSGGSDSPPPEPSIGDKIRSGGRRLARFIPGKRDDWMLIAASEMVGRLVDKVSEDMNNKEDLVRTRQ